ncbi:hypothetical protein RV05_GL000707 [Enterococcus hirae]|nr:hypothetical protein RV05_GL000707 [Enterococcus hirae]
MNPLDVFNYLVKWLAEIYFPKKITNFQKLSSQKIHNS